MTQNPSRVQEVLEAQEAEKLRKAEEIAERYSKYKGDLDGILVELKTTISAVKPKTVAEFVSNPLEYYEDTLQKIEAARYLLDRISRSINNKA